MSLTFKKVLRPGLRASESSSAIHVIDATIAFINNNKVYDEENGIIIEEFQQNCLLIHNALNMEEQIDLFNDIQKAENSKRNKHIGIATQKNAKQNNAVGPKSILIYEQIQDYGGKWMKNVFPKSCFPKILEKVTKIIEQNKDLSSCLDKKLCEYKLSQITSLQYPAPNGQLGKHCDSNPSVAFLFSIGCTCNFYAYGPSMGGNKFEDGITFKLRSGDMLFFDASAKANIFHGVMGVDSGSCPKELKEKCKGIDQCRISCQLRAW